MRYQDWDVLLFPAGEEGAHIPVKEFRTQGYVEQHHSVATPLVTSFIPSLDRGAPFQISIHSWTKTGPLLGAVLDGGKGKEVWQVNVVIDGLCVGTENFDIDATWPQIMTDDHQRQKLRFPAFHRTLLANSAWYASDHMGRIRIELSSGYLDEKHGRYHKMLGHVNFSFQPGPMDVLEHNGLAWPNARMWANPIPYGGYIGLPNGTNGANGVNGTNTMNNPMAKHRRVPSTNINVPVAMGGIGATGGIATPPLSSTFNPLPPAPDTNSNYDASSRSTSAYTTLTDSAAPLLRKDGHAPQYPANHADVMRKYQNQPFNIRLPSDQLEMIIKAIQVPHQTQHLGEPNATMPPPPIPHHAMAPKDNPHLEQRIASFGLSYPQFGEANGHVPANRREDSRFSDISMHPSCTSFPACTSEDAEGRIIHNPNCPSNPNNLNSASGPGAPSTVVRGRKEGSSPTKPRDFFSTILDSTAAPNPPPSEPSPVQTRSPVQISSTEMTTAIPPASLTSSSPADAQGSRKRARSALKSLNLNDGGSPEKKDVGTASKPPRKASRASVSSVKENQEVVSDGQENMVVDG